MSTLLLSIVTAIYVGIGILETIKGNFPGGIVFAGYALANVGVMMGLLR